MYLPDMFAVTDSKEINHILSSLSFGCFVTHDSEGFFATHVPMMIDPVARIAAGHIAKRNPHPTRCGNDDVLVIFQGADAYVTPSWYPSKLVHERVVPTWNYEVVHLTGKIAWQEDTAWLRSHLTEMSEKHERPQTRPWKLSDAPDDYIELLLTGIIGFEIELQSVQVKRKLSQNLSEADYRGVVDGLLENGRAADRDIAHTMVQNRPIE